MISKCCKMSNGAEICLKDQKIHREDGPAIVSKNGSVSYYIDGQLVTSEHWFNFCGKNNMTDYEITLTLLKYNLREYYE